MSGPIIPPLEVTEVDGSPDGRPITKIIVSNGDLTISGRTATIDTSGSGMTSFWASGDTGVAQPIEDGNTLLHEGGTGISTVASATDIITFNLDDTAVSANSYTNADITIDAQGRITAAADGTSGSMTSFDVAGDTGSAQTITNGNTLTIKNAAGGAIKTVAQATDELTIDLTVSGVTAAAYTLTNLTVDAQGRITTASNGTVEGTAILSTGETGATKFLREDGDGTCSWQAAGGGGGGNDFNGELTQYDWDGDGDAVRVFCMGPYGTTTRAIGATCVQTEEIGFFAFIVPNTGTISACDFYVTGDSGASGAINVGFYSDNDGVPETFLGEFVMATTSGGQITQTVSSGGSMGSSITTTRGDQLWISFFGDTLASTPDFGTIKLSTEGSGPMMTATYGSAAPWNCIHRTGSSGNATITDYTLLSPVSLDPINLGVKW